MSQPVTQPADRAHRSPNPIHESVAHYGAGVAHYGESDTISTDGERLDEVLFDDGPPARGAVEP